MVVKKVLLDECSGCRSFPSVPGPQTDHNIAINRNRADSPDTGKPCALRPVTALKVHPDDKPYVPLQERRVLHAYPIIGTSMPFHVKHSHNRRAKQTHEPTEYRVFGGHRTMAFTRRFVTGAQHRTTENPYFADNTLSAASYPNHAGPTAVDQTVKERAICKRNYPPQPEPAPNRFT